MVNGKEDDEIFKWRNVKTFSILLEISKKWNLHWFHNLQKGTEKPQKAATIEFIVFLCRFNETLLLNIFYHSSNCETLYN